MLVKSVTAAIRCFSCTEKQVKKNVRALILANSDRFTTFKQYIVCANAIVSELRFALVSLRSLAA